MSNEKTFLEDLETPKNFKSIGNMYSSSLIPMKSVVAARDKHISFSSQELKVLTTPRPNFVTTRPTVSCVLSKGSPDPLIELQVQEIIERQSKGLSHRRQADFDANFLKEAYQRCQKICADNAKSYYIGSLLMTEERKKAIWAIYAWGRRTDELVDGPNADQYSSRVLERWEERLEDIFNGQPYDILDTALADTVQRFPLDIQPFKDMVKGMRMDTWKTRYQNFEELELYCYYVAGTVGLMTLPVMGISPEYQASTQSVYRAALCLGIGNQLTNILRDVAEDALMGRIYLPQDELREFGLTDKDILSRNVSKQWREFMKKQITRARSYFKQAEDGTAQLDRASRWPVWASSMLYQKILDEIENNNYDNLTKQAHVGSAKKLLTLPVAYAKAMV